MVRRYAHLSGEHLATHAERMAEHLGTFSAQPVEDNQKAARECDHMTLFPQQKFGGQGRN